MKGKAIKRFWVAVAAVLLVEVAAVAIWKWWPRLFPDGGTCTVYDRYADTDGIDASFIKAYRLNDSIRTDITLLHATDSMAWALLQKDFSVPPIPEEYAALLLENESIDYRLLPKGTYTPPMNPVETDNDLVAVSRRDSTVCIVTITDQAQIDAILSWENRKLTTIKQQ